MHASAEGYDGSIMLTASHMPWNANGLKFFTAAGGFEKSDVTAMLQKAAAVRVGAWAVMVAACVVFCVQGCGNVCCMCGKRQVLQQDLVRKHGQDWVLQSVVACLIA